MTQYSFRTSGPDAWSSPRPVRDPYMRAIAYGPIQSMHKPSLLERIFGRG
ncbi:MAG: hypothetical protein ABJP70_00885 [Erythrobacter sp.]